MDVNRRLQSLEDRFALQDLITRYFVCADNDDYPGLEATLAPDVIFSASGFGDAVGREAVMEFLISSRKQMGLTVHTPNYLLMDELAEDRAKGQVGAHLELSRSGKALFGAVRYIDEYIKLDNEWKIRARSMLIIHISPWEDVGSSFTSDLTVRWPGYAPLPSELPKRKAKDL
ncbi:Bile acid 7-alpha dehydratase [Pandoraea terrae]|uniref:Bile acid 7-alpha dehydratase n=1 Tax=Pandoraea terrae TaxID=1537710 RepID=A0A5E4ZF73_9BURK|nr:nuclear transport factor 2 family protein [Pandoraea terrae]VVE59676.1 Bile acid 7-alpha dehydratase [Pandoraea terrae]